MYKWHGRDKLHQISASLWLQAPSTRAYNLTSKICKLIDKYIVLLRFNSSFFFLFLLFSNATQWKFDKDVYLDQLKDTPNETIIGCKVNPIVFTKSCSQDSWLQTRANIWTKY